VPEGLAAVDEYRAGLRLHGHGAAEQIGALRHRQGGQQAVGWGFKKGHVPARSFGRLLPVGAAWFLRFFLMQLPREGYYSL